ncbi:hypothetical protein [Brassicibacter mesophilus]|uniref:hypothetical protein n=1 Tax=Brassicibacter mesophilus TaxID=745119 RepID=UPI003D25059B
MKNIEVVTGFIDESGQCRYYNNLIRLGFSEDEIFEYIDLRVAFGGIIYKGLVEPCINEEGWVEPKNKVLWKQYRQLGSFKDLDNQTALSMATVEGLYRMLLFLDKSKWTDNENTKIIIYGDNERVIRSLNNKQGKYEKLENLISKFNDINLRWKERSFNGRANSLARKGNSINDIIFTEELMNKIEEKFNFQQKKVVSLDKELQIKNELIKSKTGKTDSDKKIEVLRELNKSSRENLLEKGKEINLLEGKNYKLTKLINEKEKEIKELKELLNQKEFDINTIETATKNRIRLEEQKVHDKLHREKNYPVPKFEADPDFENVDIE